MKRRDVLRLFGGIAAMPGASRAQSTGKMLRVGAANAQPRSSPLWAAFLRRMAELGYVEGQNFILDHVQIPNVDAWGGLFREVVARQPDVIVATGPEQSLKAAKAAAGALPIVMLAVDYDPIARGHVASLSRPGGTVTGIYFQSGEQAAKHLALMKELLPDVSSATVLRDTAAADYWEALQPAAAKAGIRLTGVELGARPYDYERALAGIPPADTRAIFALGSPFFYLDRAILAEAAIKTRSALMVQTRDAVIEGALMSYGADIRDMFALAATYVDRIAKGAKPADLPIQQPTKFDLVLNLKTAAAIGLTVPPLLLARADEVIE
jgi:putative tryptophan/tyrosine transport system substrate-binding protein